MSEAISNWNGSDEALPLARIAALQTSLLPSEQKVSSSILSDPDRVVEGTAQELADAIGVSRSTVIRACQRLGYTGYPQLRVALARQLAMQSTAERKVSGQRGASAESDVLGFMRDKLDLLVRAVPFLLDALSGAMVDRAVQCLEQATHILVVGNGLSSSLADEFALRLTAAGFRAQYVADGIGQQIAARQLGSGAVCMVVSGSGDTRISISAATAARRSGATTIALTSFPNSPLARACDLVLVATTVGQSFRNELSETSRIAHAIVLELLIDVLKARTGSNSPARESSMDVIAENLDE